jgi:enterochelin esterase-like enzyme
VNTFSKRLGGQKILDKLIAEGKMQPMIVVSAEKNPGRPKDSQCIDAVRGHRADTYVTQDLTEVLKRELRTARNRDGWALMGYSTGGFCATNLALRHPREFSAAVNLSGNYIPYIDSTTGDIFKGDKKVQAANTPQETIKRPRACPTSLYLFASRGDPVGMRELRNFEKHVKAPDAATIVKLDAGGHNFGVWQAAMPQAFVWTARVLHPYGAGVCQGSAVDPFKVLEVDR